MQVRRPSLPAVLVALALLLLTAFAALATSRSIDRRQDQLLQQRASEAAQMVDRRTEALVEKLYSTRGLFAASGRVPTPRAYEDFLAGQEFKQRYPQLRTLTWIQQVRDADRGAFLRRLRREAASSGLEYPQEIRILPRFRRPEYSIASYVYPVGDNASAVGADLFVDTAKRQAIERARDTGVVAAPLPVRLVQDPLNLSAALYMPVYAGSDQEPRREDRRRLFLGTLGAAVRLRDLIAGVAPEGTIKLYDDGLAGTPRVRRLLFTERNAPEDAPSEALPLTIAGRRWTLVYATDEQLVRGLERGVPGLIAGAGLILSLLAGAFVHATTLGRRRAVAELETSRNELARSNEELERFAFLASHDLQQPLRTVSGFLQLLERQKGDQLDERAHEYIDHALRGTKQMSSLIGDLLAYSRVARDDRPLEPVALDQVWDAAIEQLQATIEDAGAHVERSPLPVVLGDRGQLTQVFANLIVNGVKYRGDAPPAVAASAQRVNGGWEVAVQDNGRGIDPQDHERIFEMFRRLNTNDDVEGTGVGLALAKRIVERFGGDIRVESEAGRGSRFVLSLRSADPKEGA